METFSYQLEQIHQKISIKDDDRKPFTELFNTVKDWLMNAMCDLDPLFKQLFKGTELFGNYSNNVRIVKPNEFDVSILLEFPFLIHADFHAGPSGFVLLSSAYWDKDVDHDKYDTFFTKTDLISSEFQNWLTRLIKIVLDTKPLLPSRYKITHTLRKVAQNIKVIDTDKSITISIYFVPSIVMEKNYITLKPKTNKMDNMKSFLAIPNILLESKRKKCQHCKGHTFQIVNPTEERKLLWNKNNLKIVYRLLKSLRDNQNLPLLRSYFLTSIFLLEVEKQKDDFWSQPVGDIFIYMLKKLHGYFESGVLPYYWDPQYNLLNKFKKKKISIYAKILRDVLYMLEQISLLKSMEYLYVAFFFKTDY